MNRPRRFPLRLEDTVSTPRRLVSAPGQDPARTSPRVGAAAAALAPAGAVDSAPRDASAARARLVQRLREDGCRDETVLQAMGTVPRHLFVDSGLATQAYEDTSLPIGLGQTISKPTVVARMIALLRARTGPGELNRVLEIGTGCGYQAAVLCRVARQVYSIERLRELYDRARDNLAPQRPDNLRLIYGDGRLGHGPNAPYDGIIAAAGGESIPPSWLDQLAPGGRLVAPVHDAASGQQVLVVVDRLPDGSLVQSRHEFVRFVPLESGIFDGGVGRG